MDLFRTATTAVQIRQKMIAGTVSLVFLMIILVPGLTVFTLFETQRKSEFAPSTTLPAWNHDKLIESNFTGVAITIYASAVDLTTYTLKTNTFISVYGGLTLGGGDILGRVGQDFFISINNKVIEVKRYQPSPFQDLNFYFTSGNENHYPFDEYGTVMYAAAWIPPTRAEDTPIPIPISLSIIGGVASFDFNANVAEYETDNLVLVDVKLKRSWSVQLFCIFVTITMWALAICTFYMALQFGQMRFYETNLIELCTALLFALPALRSAQPGIPAVGCTADILSFFWCMMIIGCSDVVMFVKFLSWRAKEINTIATTGGKKDNSS